MSWERVGLGRFLSPVSAASGKLPAGLASCPRALRPIPQAFSGALAQPMDPSPLHFGKDRRPLSLPPAQPALAPFQALTTGRLCPSRRPACTWERQSQSICLSRSSLPSPSLSTTEQPRCASGSQALRGGLREPDPGDSEAGLPHDLPPPRPTPRLLKASRPARFASHSTADTAPRPPPHPRRCHSHMPPRRLRVSPRVESHWFGGNAALDCGSFLSPVFSCPCRGALQILPPRPWPGGDRPITGTVAGRFLRFDRRPPEPRPCPHRPTITRRPPGFRF